MWKKEIDPVIYEAPVFLSKSLAGQLYVMQFPVIPFTSSFKADAPVIHAQIKPNQDKLQVTIETDTECRYSKSKGNSIQLAATGKVSDDDNDEKTSLLREQMFESRPIPAKAKSPLYMTGLLRNGKLYITPVRSIIQMHNKFFYLNAIDEIAAKGMNEDEEGTESEVSKVTVKFKQGRGNQNKSKAPKTYRTFNTKNEEEPWIELDFYNRYDNKEFEKLCTGKNGNETSFQPNFERNGKCLQHLTFPKYPEAIIEGRGKKPDRDLLIKFSYDQLKTLPFVEQLKAIILKGKLLQNHQILEFFKHKLKITGVDEQTMIRSMQTVAVIVQGCWVVKSDILYPNNCVSDAHGISGQLMQRGRDLILSHFHEGNRLVVRKEMCKLSRLPTEEVSEILQCICVRLPNKGWEFALPFDFGFIKTNPEVAERQAMMWEAKRNRILEMQKNPEFSNGETMSSHLKRSITEAHSSSQD